MMNHHVPYKETVLHLSAMVPARPTNRKAPTSLQQARVPGGAEAEDAGEVAGEES